MENNNEEKLKLLAETNIKLNKLLVQAELGNVLTQIRMMNTYFISWGDFLPPELLEKITPKMEVLIQMKPILEQQLKELEEII